MLAIGFFGNHFVGFRGHDRPGRAQFRSPTPSTGRSYVWEDSKLFQCPEAQDRAGQGLRKQEKGPSVEERQGHPIRVYLGHRGDSG